MQPYVGQRHPPSFGPINHMRASLFSKHNICYLRTGSEGDTTLRMGDDVAALHERLSRSKKTAVEANRAAQAAYRQRQKV